MGKLPRDLLHKIKAVRNKRARFVLDTIAKKGAVTTEEIKAAGYDHPPRAARDVRELGFDLITTSVKSSSGRSIVCFRQGCINSWPGSGCYTAAPFVSLPAAAGAAGVRTWGVRRHSLLRRIRYIRFAMRPVPPMVLLCLICDVLGSPIFKQRPNEDQRRLVRIGELAVHQQPLFVQTVNCILYGRTAGGKCSPTGDPELA